MSQWQYFPQLAECAEGVFLGVSTRTGENTRHYMKFNIVQTVKEVAMEWLDSFAIVLKLFGVILYSYVAYVELNYEPEDK